MDDLKNVGENSYSHGDGTDQRVQSLVFMMMMMIIQVYRLSQVIVFSVSIGNAEEFVEAQSNEALGP